MAGIGRPMATRGIFVSPDRRMFTTKESVSSTKQEAWRRRVNLLWRIKGMVIPMDAPMTEIEKEKLNQAQTLIKEVVNNFTSNSVSLGFNAVERCHYCGNPAKDINEEGFYVCENCMRHKIES